LRAIPARRFIRAGRADPMGGFKMPQIRLDIDDAEALLSIANAYRGIAPAAHFTDRTRTTLRPFFAVAVANMENALRNQRAKPTALKTRKSGRGV
jgi:hypothetical protein